MYIRGKPWRGCLEVSFDALNFIASIPQKIIRCWTHSKAPIVLKISRKLSNSTILDIIIAIIREKINYNMNCYSKHNGRKIISNVHCVKHPLDKQIHYKNTALIKYWSQKGSWRNENSNRLSQHIPTDCSLKYALEADQSSAYSTRYVVTNLA